MIKVKYQSYSGDANMGFVEVGYNKFMLYGHNVDTLNTLILFCILTFDEPMELDFPVDDEFWYEWIDFVGNTIGHKFPKIIIPKSGCHIVDYKPNLEPALLFSGGKDSTASKNFLDTKNSLDTENFIEAKNFIDTKKIGRYTYTLLQYIVQVYKPLIIFGAKTMSTNFDDILFHNNPKMSQFAKLELYLPIISNHRKNYIGIEKELWDDPSASFFYDMKAYTKLLEKYRLEYDSPVKNLYSNEILKILKYDKSFIKCDSTDTGKENEFCYECPKCLILYCQNCNLEDHGFDRDKFRNNAIERGRPFGNIVEYLTYYHNSMIKIHGQKVADAHNIFLMNLVEKFGVV